MTKMKLLLVVVVFILMSSAGVLLAINNDQNTTINTPHEEYSNYYDTTRSEYSSSPINITTTDLPSRTEDEPYSVQLNAIGGTGNYTWEIVSGELPPGISLSPDGIISGEPDDTGTFIFTVRVTDDNESMDNRILTIEVLREESSNILWLCILIIVVVIITILVLVIMKKKGAEPMPSLEEEDLERVEKEEEEEVEEEMEVKDMTNEREGVEEEFKEEWMGEEEEGEFYDEELKEEEDEPRRRSTPHEKKERPRRGRGREPLSGRKGKRPRRERGPPPKKESKANRSYAQLNEVNKMEKKIEEKMKVLMGQRKINRLAILGIVIFFVVVLFLALTIRRVPAGHVGVYTNGMNIGTQKDSGWVFKNPFSTMDTIRHNTQEIRELVIVTSVEEDGSGYNVPMDFQVVYHLEEAKVGKVIVENPDYKETKIIQKLRSRTRQIVAENNLSGIEINQMKSWIQTEVSRDLTVYLKDFHIIVEEVALRNVELPQNIQQASQMRAKSEIEITTARNLYLSEMEVVKKKIANADADYNVTVIGANAKKQQLIIEASGRAEAIMEIQGQFNISETNLSAQVYLQYLYVSALSDPNSNIQFFIVPTGEDGMPIILDMGGLRGER